MPEHPTKKRARGNATQEGARLPEVVYAQASPRSIGGVSLFDTSRPVTSEVVPAFISEEGVIRSAASQLAAAGFQILQVSPVTINIAGPPALYEEAFGARLVAQERPVIKQGGGEETATFVDSADTDLPGLISTARSRLGDLIEGVAIEEPRYPMEIAFAPTKQYWHLRVPGDISAGCNADKAHRSGITGRGIKVVMCDSGWYRHPYFVRRGYRASPVVLGPGTTNPIVDEDGHGTGESANVFATAPDVDFTMVKSNSANWTGAFNSAVALAPHIISCSWGTSVRSGPLSAADQALAASIAVAGTNGIVVVFAAGNGHFGFPGQHPDVISAGGVYMEPDGTLRASDYASGFASNVYPGRNVPDVSGLVGIPPNAFYIMLPIPPGCFRDRLKAGATHPDGDETTSDDGWSAFSGTSAAAPQIAGVCALLKQANPNLTPAEVRAILMETATDVTRGQNAHRNTAARGYDLATGAGLVDANWAVSIAQFRRIVSERPSVIVGHPITPPPQPPRPIELSPIRHEPPPTKGLPRDVTQLVSQLAAADWSQEQVAAAVAAQSPGVTPDEAAMLQEAILQGPS